MEKREMVVRWLYRGGDENEEVKWFKFITREIENEGGDVRVISETKKRGRGVFDLWLRQGLDLGEVAVRLVEC